MARKLNMAVLVVIALAAMLQGSTAVTTYVVGDALGWTVPPGGPIAYSTWATNKTFTVGDTLVFNFTTGAHDVARVTKAAFDSCNGTSTISTATTGPTNITLSAAGEYYFICTFGSHCTLGQKLAINVTAAGPSPAPEPSTPSPASAPTPTASRAPTPSPSRAPMTYEVGDSLGWNVPPGGPIAYQTWAFNKTFMVGDTLVFNFTNGVHNVAEVAKAAYDSCNTTTTISLTTTSPARITLTTPGTHYYTCTFPNHCTLGQKLAINVTGSAATPPTSAATPPTSAATPPSSSATPPSSSATPPSTSTTPTTPSSPAPTGSDVVPPPPPASSAPSFSAAAGLSTVVLSIAVALLY